MFEFSALVDFIAWVIERAEKDPAIHEDLQYAVDDFKRKVNGIVAHHAADLPAPNDSESTGK
jgi:hypothetical protein